MSYRYMCEEKNCNNYVEMSQAEYMRLPTGAYGRRVRCSEHQAMFNVNIARAPSLKGKGTYRSVCCSKCGGVNPVRHYKTHPVNFHYVYALLCNPCAAKAGWARVDYQRAS